MKASTRMRMEQAQRNEKLITETVDQLRSINPDKSEKRLREIALDIFAQMVELEIDIEKKNFDRRCKQ